jgi:N-acetyl sugar amidotransferase
VKYCTECVYPDTKPDLVFDAKGVCSACTAFKEREKIDWTNREYEFKNIVESTVRLNKQYDCVIPVSGGKDSHYQCIKALEYGLHPLAVCATTDDLSAIGAHNLRNISKLGIDLIEITPNAKIRRNLNAYTLREIGDISWCEHITIFTIPVTVAVQRDIPLIVWGENPQHEYGGPYKAQTAKELNLRWLQEFGGLNGLRLSDLIDRGVISGRDAHLYRYPPMQGTNVKGIFLGQFFPWDGAENARIAVKHGFKTYFGPVEGIGYDYENLDNHQTGVHDYFKYLKFGFGRCSDLASNHIRRRSITRREAIEIVMQHDGKYPTSYLGKSLEEILDPLGMDPNEFLEICNKFANKNLFECRKGRIPRALFKEDIGK